MEGRSPQHSRLIRSSTVVESGRVSIRWKPTDYQKQILDQIFMSGTRRPSVDERNQITAQLQRYGRAEGKNIFYWFQNAAAREKRKKEQPQSSTKRPSVFKSPKWTSVFRCKRSSDKGSMQEEEVNSGARRNSSVDLSDIRTLELFPLHPHK